MAERSLGKKIKEARLELKITQKELAGDVITRNMLSQIENDLAMPSIKTLEHVANMLGKPVSYFIGDIKKAGREDESTLDKVMRLYDEGLFYECLSTIENYFAEYPKKMSSDMLKTLYMNCCYKSAIAHEEKKDYEAAKESFLKIVDFNKDYMDIHDLSIFNIYSKLSEVYSSLEDYRAAKEYDELADHLVDKIKIDRSLQSIYVKYLANQYQEVINLLKKINVDELPEKNRGRYFMMMGSSLFNTKKYALAVKFLEKALEYYKGSTVIIRQVIYKELSTCFSEMEEYKKAYECLQKAQENFESE